MEFVSGRGREGREGRSLLMGAGGRGKERGLPPTHLVPQVLRLVEAQATHFQQGHEELSRLAQYRKELGGQVETQGTGRWKREGRGSEMTLLAWFWEAGPSEMPLLCSVTPAGLEFGSREEGHGAETRAAETEGEGWAAGRKQMGLGPWSLPTSVAL